MERQGGGKFAPMYKGPYVVKNVRPNGLTMDLVDPVTGTELVASSIRIEFFDSTPNVYVLSRSLPRATQD